MTAAEAIPVQPPIPWSEVLYVSLAGIRRRIWRSVITIACVVLAIAFVTYMLVLADINEALVRLNDPALNLRLQDHGIDIYAATQKDSMTMLLIGLALFTCTVGIINTMLMSVTERIREIGTLKCLGARDIFIVQTYFVESSVQGVAGAAIGLLLGALLAVGIAANMYGAVAVRTLPVAAMARSILIALGCGLLVAVLAAIVPARAVARKQPVDALRVEE